MAKPLRSPLAKTSLVRPIFVRKLKFLGIAPVKKILALKITSVPVLKLPATKVKVQIGVSVGRSPIR